LSTTVTQRAPRPGRASVWPTPGHELLAKAALFDERRALAAWQEWKDRNPPSTDRHPRGLAWIAPLLHRNLGGRVAGDPWLAEAGRMRARNVRKALRLRGKLVPVLRALGERGIGCMLLKGSALARTVYPDEGLRPMSDLDVLVPTSAALSACAVLEALGASPASRPRDAPDLLWRHASSWRLAADGELLDLHWHLLPDCCWADADASFWREARRIDVAGVESFVLSWTDQLLHVVVHGVRWSAVPAPRFVADALLLLRIASAEIDWERLAAEAESRRLTVPLREGLAYLRRVFEAPVPDHALERLRRARPSWREERAFLARALSPPRRGLLDAAMLHADEHAVRVRAGAVTSGLRGLATVVARTWGLSGVARLPIAAVGRIGGRAAQRTAAAVRRGG
jgi:hypothetical protein